MGCWGSIKPLPIFLNQQGKSILIDQVLEKLETYQKGDGWYNDRPPDNIRINGIMKVFTGLDIIKYDYSKIHPLVKRIIDSIINKDPADGACNIYDFVYVLTRSIEIEYRTTECLEKLHNTFNKILSHQHLDGGFSFNKNSTTQYLYGKNITKGKSCGGIHGTTLFCLALANLDRFSNLGLDLKVPIT